jgi:hypothetical protein
MNDPTSILEQDQRRIGAGGKRGAIVKRVRGSVCLLVLIAFFAVGVGGRPGSEANAAEVKVPRTGNIAPTATVAPEPDADRRNEDEEQVTTLARFKAH